ncbi:glutamate 5-kinase [Granulosicoccaceae sp. 1_MG-2023]|nr:glutamate 5-kinase [Granulosicoccaceae sp. 1_MG-2023]
MRNRLINARRWVIKVGSSLVTADGAGLDLDATAAWARQIAELNAADCEVVLVSSGSIAEGMSRLGWHKRPDAVHELQAAAAVGQMGLVQAYESHFREHSIQTAQILLTHADLANRQRYLNARSTLTTLISLGVTPIINENDTVTTDEIRFGDNDTLSALVANLIDADTLVILTDQQGLFDCDPRKNPHARLIERATAGDPALLAMAGPSGSHIGSGGMSTKLTAAERAARSGTTTIIASGREQNVLPRLKRGEAIGTMLTAGHAPMLARKQWLANQLKARGTLTLDEGACRVLRERGSSLLAVGVTDVTGEFMRGELVRCVDSEGKEVARGLTNYHGSEVRKLMGQPSSRIAEILGYVDQPELINRDNMVVQAG